MYSGMLYQPHKLYILVLDTPVIMTSYNHEGKILRFGLNICLEEMSKIRSVTPTWM
jgi:hypothetical protein